MAKNQPQEVNAPEKYVIKQKTLFTLSMTYLLSFILTIIITVMIFINESIFIGILFCISTALFGYVTLYVLSRAQYDLVQLINSYRTMLILCILSFFAMYPPLMMFFSRWALHNLTVYLCLSDAILIIINIAILSITTLIMNKKTKKLLKNKKYKHK